MIARSASERRVPDAGQVAPLPEHVGEVRRAPRAGRCRRRSTTRESSTRSSRARGRAASKPTAPDRRHRAEQPIRRSSSKTAPWYREQSKDMERTIRDGRLMEKQGADPTAPQAEPVAMIAIEEGSERLQQLIAGWRYPRPYDFYDGDAEPVLNPERFFEARDEHGYLVGFYYFEQKPPYLAYGLGLRPELTGPRTRARVLPRRPRVRTASATGRGACSSMWRRSTSGPLRLRARGLPVVSSHVRTFEHFGKVPFLTMIEERAAISVRQLESADVAAVDHRLPLSRLRPARNRLLDAEAVDLPGTDPHDAHRRRPSPHRGRGSGPVRRAPDTGRCRGRPNDRRYRPDCRVERPQSAARLRGGGADRRPARAGPPAHRRSAPDSGDHR